MDAMSGLLHGFGVALTATNLLWALVGVTLGTAVGVLPGIGPALTVALLLPATGKLDPVGAFIMFGGIYYGAMYGSSTTSILLNTPGENSSVVTAIEGHMMAKRGRGAAALATAAIGSFVAGTIATFGVALFAPTVVRFALGFGPADYFALMLLAFTTVTAVLGTSLLRGLASLFLGLTLGLVGIDMQTGQARLTLGLSELLDGIPVVILAVGLFAVGEALFVLSREALRRETIIPVVGRVWMTAAEWRRSVLPWLRGAFIGFPFGTLPAGGAEIPTFLSYSVEKKLTKHPEEFGQGAIEGVAGPEATNNAAVTGVLVPLLTLGLPTSATAAIMLAAFQQYGLQPGPLLFQSNADLIWGLIASLYIGNVMLLVLNLPLAGVWVRLLAIPRPHLYAGIMVFATLGVFSLHGSVFDLGMLLVFGLMGYLMRCADMPVAPAIIGLILGPLAEQQLRRALAISQGDPTVFFTRPLSATILAIALAVLLLPPLYQLYRQRFATGMPRP
ncbi:MAG TPA: tripartite tricarboxylate transporter permease [Hyphomicrobiaceae bacterium]|nr:tripartite tricarboxylate transporter permease [Hyphomicrobiaceae bacterium]